MRVLKIFLRELNSFGGGVIVAMLAVSLYLKVVDGVVQRKGVYAGFFTGPVMTCKPLSSKEEP